MSDKRAPKPLEDLDARLRRLKAEVEPKDKTEAPPPSGMGLAFELSGHLVAGVLVGAGVGYGLDQWLGTAPWMLVVFFFMGAAAGMLNVYRTVTGKGMALGYRPTSEEAGSGREAAEASARDEKDATKKGE